MRKTSEILRLRWEKGLSIRQIASSVGLSRSTVQDHLARAELAGLSWPLPEGMTDAALEELVFPTRQIRNTSHQPDFAYIHKELTKKRGYAGASVDGVQTGKPGRIPIQLVL